MNIIIFHGAYGHPNENWFPWLKDELSKIAIDCIIPAFPTPCGQTLEAWLRQYQTVIADHVTSSTILIGHSLGARFLLSCLYRSNVKVLASILVGAFIEPVGITDFDVINQSFLMDAIDWEVIREKCQQFICYYGMDDPYVDIDQFNVISQRLLARKVIISAGRHLNKQAGFDQFPHMMREIKGIHLAFNNVKIKEFSN